jgi:hypothetical protein
VESNELFAVLAIALSLISIVGLVVVGAMLRGYRRNQRVIMGSRGTVDVAEHMAVVDDKLTNLRLAVEDLTMTARDHGVCIDGTLSHVGIVRFDAYHDLGGRQSTAVAFMNSRNDGVVITTVVSREFARMYVKMVRDGVGDIPLAPEENEAVQQARKAAPFVAKPAAEGGSGLEAPEEGSDLLPDGQPMVLGLPGPYEAQHKDARALERENRRRKRKGLAPVKNTELLPSAMGWEAPGTPAPPGASMAEQFVRQRKQGRRTPIQTREEEQWPSAAPDDGWPYADSDEEDRWPSALPDDDDTRDL